MRKPRILELDIVRAFAIMAVLMIHATSETTVEIPIGSRSQIIYLIVNKLSNFAVPVFILLSGLVLFYRYGGAWNWREALSFYRKRIQYIIVPYLIWSFFYYVFNQWTPNFNWHDIHIEWPVFFKALKWADTSYHLYFIVLILQFYLVFPIIMTIVERWRWFGRNLIWIGIAVQVGFYVYHHWFHPVQHPATILGTYAGIFAIGGWIGLHYERFQKAADRHLWWVLGLALLIGYSFALLFVLHQSHIDFGSVIMELLFNGYAIAMSLSLLWISAKLLRGLPRLAALLSSMGFAAFGIYFTHPALLSLWRRNWTYPSDTLAYHLSTIGAGIMIFTVPWLLVFVLRKWKGSWILFGK